MLAAVSAEEGRVRTVRTFEVLRALFCVRAFYVIAKSAVMFVFGVAELADLLLARVTTLPVRLHHHPRLVPARGGVGWVID